MLHNIEKVCLLRSAELTMGRGRGLTYPASQSVLFVHSAAVYDPLGSGGRGEDEAIHVQRGRAGETG